MFQCPQCSQFTFPLRKFALSRVAVCPNCHTAVRQRRSWRNGLVALPFAALTAYQWRKEVQLVEGLVAIGIAGSVGLVILNWLVKLEVMK